MKPEELERSFSPGELILERGTEARELFIVREGQVVLERDDGGSPRRLGSGQVFGELGALLGAPSPYRALADEEVTVLSLDPTALNQLCAKSPEFNLRLMQHLAERLEARELDVASFGPVDDHSASSYEKLVPMLFKNARGTETPMAVDANLKELSQEAGLLMLDAYTCIQRLLENRILRLVDDQLSIVEPKQLQELGSA